MYIVFVVAVDCEYLCALDTFWDNLKSYCKILPPH